MNRRVRINQSRLDGNAKQGARDTFSERCGRLSERRITPCPYQIPAAREHRAPIARTDRNAAPSSIMDIGPFERVVEFLRIETCVDR